MAELLHEKELVNTLIARSTATMDDMKDIVDGIHKIIDNKDELVN